MNATRMRRRLKKLEQRSSPGDGTFTLEELCRAIWLSDKKHFLDLANQTCLSFFVRQFRFEDAERARQTARSDEGNSVR
jgi:hypothetical protein